MKISAAAFRSNCFKIIDEISQKQIEVIITKRGKAVAKLTPCETKDRSDPLIGALTGAGETVKDLTEPFYTDWELD